MLMEIMAHSSDAEFKGERFNFDGIESMRASFPDLQPAMAEKKVLRGDNKAITIKYATGDEKVGCACLVFKRDETMSIGSAGSLSTNDKSGAADLLAVRDSLKIACSNKERRVSDWIYRMIVRVSF